MSIRIREKSRKREGWPRLLATILAVAVVVAACDKERASVGDPAAEPPATPNASFSAEVSLSDERRMERSVEEYFEVKWNVQVTSTETIFNPYVILEAEGPV